MPLSLIACQLDITALFTLRSLRELSRQWFEKVLVSITSGSVGEHPTTAMLLFVVTGQISVWLGLGLGTLVAPGSGVDASAIEMGATPEPNPTTAVDMILSIVPESPVQVMADVSVLPLIVFSMLIGIGILMAKEEGLPVQKVFDSGAVIMQKVTMVVMELTPFGVFALMAWVAGTLGFDAQRGEVVESSP